MIDGDIGALRAENEQLRANLERANRHAQELEDKFSSLQANKAAPESSIEATPLDEMEMTLRRLVQRIAMILQAEKTVWMLYERESGELVAMPPAYGVDEDSLNDFRVRATQGLSGQVFREGRPLIFMDAVRDPRTIKENVAYFNIFNGVAVPLTVVKRDEQNRVIDKQTIGVLHVWNKRHGEEFNDEDVLLLDRLASSLAAVISNMRIYQEVVEERKELLQTIESLYAGLVLVSADGRLSQMNASARSIFGLGNEAIGRQYDQAFKSESTLELFRRGLEQIKTAEGAEAGMDAELTISREGHEHIYQAQCATVRAEDRRPIGIVAIFNDITEMRNIERMKSSFVATVSHELRTPLTSIKGFVATLLMDDGSFEEVERREFYGIIDSECDRLTRLINDMLNIARIEAGESLKPRYGEVDAHELAQKVVLIQRQSTTKHTIVLDSPEELPHITADEDKLDQILTNLVNNSVKYSPGGGEIKVSIEQIGDKLKFGVHDQGMGIPKDHLPKVFDKFHRVDNRDSRKVYGTGLGLFLVKHLVEEIHDGRIWAESEVGQGSTFWFEIPIHLDTEKMDARAADARGPK
jgi:PAS domain S-box-containing protein